MQPEILRGTDPGYGDGSGYGYGDGYGYGSGYGYGYGYGSGDGYGYGSGSGSIIRATVSVEWLTALKACSAQVKLFQHIFPEGARWPEDKEKALAAGLDIAWAKSNLNLTEGGS